MTAEQTNQVKLWATVVIRKKNDPTKFENKLFYLYNKGYDYDEAYLITRILIKLGYDTVVTSGAASSTIYIRKWS